MAANTVCDPQRRPVVPGDQVDLAETLRWELQRLCGRQGPPEDREESLSDRLDNANSNITTTDAPIQNARIQHNVALAAFLQLQAVSL